MRFQAFDEQANLAFVRNQANLIEPQVYQTQYPSVQYPELIPVDTSAPEFIQAVTYLSTDMRGAAQWINANAQDIPNVMGSMSESTTSVHSAGIGYGYGWQELGFARMLNINLTTDRAEGARRISEEFIDSIVWVGDTPKGFKSFISNSNITPANVANNAAASSRLWTAKTGSEVLKDINEALIDTYTVSNQIEMADTLLLSPGRWAYLGTTPWSADNSSNATLLDMVMTKNLYTAKTGQPLKIGTVRELATAGASTTQRMVTYTRRPDCVKLHLPMPHRFLPVQNKGALYFEVPGVFRLGGVDIRRLGTVRYRDAF